MLVFLHSRFTLPTDRCITYQVYTFALAIINVADPGDWGNISSYHMASVLFTSWALLVYRDVWPLATFTLSPVDIYEGWIMWAKLVTLTIAAIIVPSFAPRTYVPLDPKVRVVTEMA